MATSHAYTTAGRGSPADDRDSWTWTLLVVFLSIALYNVIELNFLILSTFKRYRGLYFWSFLASTWGVAFNAVGYMVRDVELHRPGYAHATIILIGWCAMVTGQSLVLYSRLHFVLHSQFQLRCILTMIIVNAIWLSIPVIVLVYGSSTDNPEPFRKPYAIFEKLQLTVFTVQELIISGLYILETAKLIKFQRDVVGSATRRVMGHLLLVNVLVVLLDISVLALEFTEHYNMQTAWKPLVYSLKLKVEFTVLNKLVEFSQQIRSGGSLGPQSADTAAEMAIERYRNNNPSADEPPPTPEIQKPRQASLKASLSHKKSSSYSSSGGTLCGEKA
ncbi:hypothetical protein CDD82_4438 [Ophiocordyceps australis]|uniref:DUF7703 domain-containing protein n=1 Tax=Ophiocordyceps australis TaxID=1399860 RepID=A0A2C5Z6W7_9HYPO|nr:hypothetical protein CDD82_4438 [Ophiocordyceps australis]